MNAGARVTIWLVLLGSLTLGETAANAAPSSLHRSVTADVWLAEPKAAQRAAAEDLIRMQARRRGEPQPGPEALDRRARALMEEIKRTGIRGGQDYVGQILDRIWISLQR